MASNSPRSRGLNHKLEAELKQKNEQIAELERRLERLEQLVSNHIPGRN
jgi:predicted RNase H-like nuclease (RuvC/YqgF family)